MEANLKVPGEQELNCDLPCPHDRLKSVHETGNVFLTLINILADHDWLIQNIYTVQLQMYYPKFII